MNGQRILSYEDIGYNQFFEKKVEDIGERRKGIEKIAVEAIPELSTADVRRIIERIPVEILPRLSAADVSHLIEAMPPELIEKKLFESENKRLIIDLTDGKILLRDDTTNRILFDGSTGAFKISNVKEDVKTAADDDLLFHFNPTSATLEIKGEPVNTFAQTFSHLSVEHFWTGSSTYTDRTGTYFEVDGKEFKNQDTYFETVMAVEQGGRTAYTRIWNMTDGKMLAGSEITGHKVGITNPERIRSDSLTFPSGSKLYKLQIKQTPAGGTGDNAHFYAARLVHKLHR